MSMESPERICLGAVLVVNLLLLGTIVCSDALSTDVPPTNLKHDELSQSNTTWTPSRPKSSDIPFIDPSINESGENNAEKNFRRKHRGTVKYHTKVSTESMLRRVRSTEPSNFVIVTPTPEVKKPAEIIDSMRSYKKTKMPTVTSSTTPMPIKNEVRSTEEEYEDEEEEEKESFERFTSNKYHDSRNFFTIPSFDFEDTKKKDDYTYSSPSYDYSNFFQKKHSGFEDTSNNHFGPDSFFDFDSDLTTPRNDIFDKKFKEISDPVLQSEVSGLKKVIHSKTVLDNSIPSLMKRGSTKFATSTASSTEVEDGKDMEIPPTMAFALATLKSLPPLPKSLPPLPSTVADANLIIKSADENELQKVGEIIDKKEITTSSTTILTPNPISNDVIPKQVIEVDQNKLLPISSSTIPETEVDMKPESISAESVITNMVQTSSENNTESSEELSTEETKSANQPYEMKEVTPLWMPSSHVNATTQNDTYKTPSMDTSKTKHFESITKLPAGVTTPLDETAPGPDITLTTETISPSTDYQITTIRFSYVPTDEVKEITKETTESVDTTTMTITEPTTDYWHPITNEKISTIVDGPVTTYRPKYILTTEEEAEATTIAPETISVIEVSSQVVENITEKSSEQTQISKDMTAEITTEMEESTEVSTTTNTATINITTSTMPSSSESPITTSAVTTTTTETTTMEDTTTVVVEVVTEINTEKEIVITSPTTTETPCTEEQETTTHLIPTDMNILAHTVPTTEKATSTAESAKPTTEGITTTVHFVKIPTTTTEEKLSTIVIPSTTVEQETKNPKILSTTELVTESDYTTKNIGDLEDLTSYDGDATTESSSRVLEDSGSGAAIAIAVSTIGVIALVLLIGLLLVVRRRGRRGVYAQRCTPVSLDAYSLDSVSVGHRKGNHRLRASKRSYGNPAYDDEVTSHPMQYPALANFAMDLESMTAEFAEIPSVTVRPEEVPPGCEDKNRYSNVLPLPETRVPLSRIGSDPTTEYINANYITGPGNIRNYYIACQAPLSNTVVDFWRMIWEQNSRLIVMLTEYMENGVEKCYEYLPPSEITDNKRSFGEFKIILKKREHRDKYCVSSVQLINLATRTWREVTHLWYFWPAKGVPDDYDSVIDFLSEMRSFMKISQTAKEYDEEGVEVIYGEQSRSSLGNLSKLRSEESSAGNGVNAYSPAKAEQLMRRHANNGTLGRTKAASDVEGGVRPCVVCCASGAGRAAALVALDVCARALAAGSVDVPRVVRHLRAQRPHSLSNRHHYIFLYKVLSEYGNKLMGGGVDAI